jgi:hypothetical protein
MRRIFKTNVSGHADSFPGVGLSGSQETGIPGGRSYRTRPGALLLNFPPRDVAWENTTITHAVSG